MWESIQQVSTLLGILALAFTAGYNWRRITVVEHIVAEHLGGVEARNAWLAQTYARKDLLELEIKAIKSRLEYISQQLTDLRRDSHA